VPLELPFRSTDAVPKKEDPSKYFSDFDLSVAQLMPSSCKTKSFEITYQAKISIMHDQVIGKNRDSERFQLKFSQVRQEEIIVRRRTGSFDEIELVGREALKQSYRPQLGQSANLKVPVIPLVQQPMPSLSYS
jgi:hypothetical protein